VIRKTLENIKEINDGFSLKKEKRVLTKNPFVF
jgi:hypothetical protein